MAGNDHIKLPYVVRERCEIAPSEEDRAQGAGPIIFAVGAQGFTLDRTTCEYEVPDDCHYVTIPAGGSTFYRNCTVESRYIEIGTVEVGKWQTVFDVSRAEGVSAKIPETAMTQDPITMAASTFFSAARSNKHLLPLMTETIRDLTDKEISTVSHTIRAGVEDVSPALLAVLESSNYTLAQIMDTATNIQQGGGKQEIAGVYLIVHQNAPGLSEVYVGSSNNVEHRFSQHDSNSRDPKHAAAHYRSWRRTTEHRMFLLCRIDASRAGGRQNLYFAELFFIAMVIGSYPSWLLSHQPNDMHVASEFAEQSDDPDNIFFYPTNAINPFNTGAASETLNPSAQQSEAAGGRTSTATVLAEGEKINPNFLVMRSVATMIADLAQDTMRVTQWPGGSHREAFGPVKGLNVSTPLCYTEHHTDPIVYMKLNWPQHMDVFVRSSQKVNKGAQGGHKLQLFKTAGSDRLLQSYWRRDVEPPSGTDVFVYIEIMHNDQPHPHGYARLPDFPGASDWDTARSLGIRITWRDSETNVPRSRHIQSSLKAQMSTTRRGPPGSYSQAMGVIRSLRQQKLAANAPKMLDLYPPALIVRGAFNWLDQTFYVDTMPNITEVQAGYPYNPTTRTQVLVQQYGAQNLHRPWASKDRSRCDLCYVCHSRDRGNRLDVASAPSQQCTQVPGTESCTNCINYGILCTWTPYGQIRQSYRDFVKHKVPFSEIEAAADPMPITIKEGAHEAAAESTPATVEES